MMPNPLSDRPVRVLFVCLGNICRSPLAEGLFQEKVVAAGLGGAVEVDSAGTGGWHVGAPPDRRMTATAARRGTDLSQLKARQLVRHDLDDYDHVFVMDKANLHDTLALDPDGDHGTRVRLFREFDPEPGDYQVPDPYYGGPEGFDHVFDIADRTTDAILQRLAEVYGWDLASSS
ncbi:protein tyrosine phosphatase [Rubrivirga sp. SAORIC476]|nr:protein tyrosine phosphatase [Rubrivirga sp. SAORIC476]